MQYSFTQVDKHLYRIQVDTDYTNFIPMLESAKWDKETSFIGDYLAVSNLRKHNTPKPLLEYKNFFANQTQFKDDLISTMFENEIFQQKNTEDRQTIMSKTEIISSWIKTPGQYTQGFVHTDRHTPYVHGLIYMIQGNDPNQSTWFAKYDDPQDVPDNLYPFETGIGIGWIVVATNRSWHRALNATDHARYCLKISLDPINSDFVDEYKRLFIK